MIALEPHTQLSNPEIALLTAQQITKDFGLYGVTIEFDKLQSELDYPTLKQILIDLVRSVVHSGNHRMQGILYQIDVSPKILQNLVSMTEEEQINFVSEQIIIRELKKVLSRIYYKQKKDNELKLGQSDINQIN